MLNKTPCIGVKKSETNQLKPLISAEAKKSSYFIKNILWPPFLYQNYFKGGQVTKPCHYTCKNIVMYALIAHLYTTNTILLSYILYLSYMTALYYHDGVFDLFHWKDTR